MIDTTNTNFPDAIKGMDFPTSKFNSDEGKKLKMPVLKKFSPRMMLGAVVLVLMMLGGVSGYFLTQMNQDVRQQATGEIYNSAGGACSSEGQIQCGGDGREIQCAGREWRQLTSTCGNQPEEEIGNCCIFKSQKTYTTGITPGECNVAGGSPVSSCSGYCLKPDGCSGWVKQ